MFRIHQAAVAAAIGAMLVCSGAASAATKADYDAAKARSEADYKAAADQCRNLSGNPKDICIAEAKAARVKVDAMAEADYKNTPKAREDAKDSIADADYDVAKQRCDARTGNEKDVCLKEAKAAQVRVKADAKAAQKSAVARNDAAGDKRDADYKVALEKCDALAGASKDDCRSSARSTYGK